MRQGRPACRRPPCRPPVRRAVHPCRAGTGTRTGPGSSSDPPADRWQTGVGVVGGELGIDGLGHRQQLAGAGEVGDVRVGLAGIDRVAFQPFLLGALDLAVPVGALHQTDHQAVTAALGEIDDVVDHIGAALLVGLDDEADAVPVGEGRIEAELLQQIEEISSRSASSASMLMPMSYCLASWVRPSKVG